MRNLLKQCIGWLDWRFVAGSVAVLIALAVCGNLPTLSIFAGATPLVLLLACLIPCLLPLALFRRGQREQRDTPRIAENTHDGSIPPA